jgi:DNA-binding GntR family transcriptional regulator
LLSLPLERRSLFATLEREHGIELQYADEEVDATPASARIAELLGIHAGARAAHSPRFVLHRWQSHRRT